MRKTTKEKYPRADCGKATVKAAKKGRVHMITHGNEIKLFSGNSNKELANAIAKKLNTELGEIEVNVNMLEEIKLSGCIYDTEKGKIVLYYVGDMESGELTKVLREKLPRYMIPNYVEKLEEMPLTPNGKINRVFLKEKYKNEH